MTSILSLSRTWTDNGGRVIYSDQYFDVGDMMVSASLAGGASGGILVNLPTPTDNSADRNRTSYTYDSGGNQATVTDAVGTITSTQYDGLNRATTVSMGTSMGNLLPIDQYDYDNDQVGDGNVTQVTNLTHNLNAPVRVTNNYYDWRDRLVASDNTVAVTYDALDNLGEATRQDVYDDSAGGAAPTLANGAAPVNADGTVVEPSVTTSLRSRTASSYDNDGEAYSTVEYSVDPSTGIISGSITLTTNIFHDADGQVIETDAPGGLVTKYGYDGAGRDTLESTGSSSTVLNSVTTTYDDDGNAILVATADRLPNDSGYRTSYVTDYYDSGDRLVGTADWGTNGGSAPSAPGVGSTPPASSNAVHVTGYSYGPDGYVQDTTAPDGVVTHDEYDALGELITSIANYVPGSPLVELPDQNKVTGYAYNADGEVTSVSVTDVSPQEDESGKVLGYTKSLAQRTLYTYGGSGTISSSLLTKTMNPDGSGMTETYDSQGDVLTETQATGVTHTYFYNAAGRQIGDLATIPSGSTIDSTVQKLTTTYNALNQPVRLSSEGPVNGTWSTINQVWNVYNGLGQIATQYEEYNGAATTNSLHVQYNYDQSNNHSRLSAIVYPDGRTIWYGYNSGLDNAVSRVSSIADDNGSNAPGQQLENYSYLGVGTVVGRNLSQPGIQETTTLTSFGQVQGMTWNQGSTPLDGYQYSYDTLGDVTNRTNSLNSGRDESYTYNSLSVMTAFVPATIGDPAYKTWVVDSQGNRIYAGASYNDNNELSTSQYNADGDAQTLAMGADATTSVEYDAWGRVTGLLTNGTNSTAPFATHYEYDAIGRQVETVSINGVTVHTFYDIGNNPLEERDGNGVVQTQYVWSGAGPSRLVLRDSNADGDSSTGRTGVPGGLEQRIYALSDAAGSTTALVDYGQLTGQPSPIWQVAERFSYGADGEATVYGPTWTPLNASNDDQTRDRFGWTFLWQGQRWHALYEGFGLYSTADGSTWYDPQTDQTLTPQPVLPGADIYHTIGEDGPGISNWWDRNAGWIAGSSEAGIGLAVTYLSAGLLSYYTGPLTVSGFALAAEAGGLVGGGLSGYGNGYIAGHSGWQLAGDTATGAAIGAAAGAAGGYVGGAVAGEFCPAAIEGWIAGGAAGGAAAGGVEGSINGGINGGWQGALTGGLQGALFGGLTGAAGGAIAYGAFNGLGLLDVSAPSTASEFADAGLGVEDLSLEYRTSMQLKYQADYSLLQNQGFIPHNGPLEAAYERMAGITAGYDIEVGLVRSGEDLAIIPGGPRSINLSGYDEAIAHTHPSGILEFSPEDLQAFARDYPSQSTSVLIAPDGIWKSLPLPRP